MKSMDDILRDSHRAERASNIRMGAFLVIAGVAISVGLFVLASGPGFQLFVIPSGVIGFGLYKLSRGLAGKSAD
jgi:hypothetical protein